MAIRNKDSPDAGLQYNTTYSVYCNHCDASIPDAHYHCGICDDGDFDLCPDCVGKGVLCGGEGHWMIKRYVKYGKVINSTTEIAPKKTASESKTTLVADERENTRTCNSCVDGKHLSFSVTSSVLIFMCF
jgi:next-to-BRCA1 protein 1